MNKTQGRAKGRTTISDRDHRSYSVRLSGPDLRRLKTVARRLGVSESDLIRFALRQTVTRLAPLQDDFNTGASLLPVFVDHGQELIRSFNLDTDSLERILNANVKEGQGIAREDIGLLLLAGEDETRLFARLRELTELPAEPESVMTNLRAYLYRKYLYKIAS